MGRLLDTFTLAINTETQLLPFLELTGWTPVNSGNKRWSVWNSPARTDNKSFEMVFPKDPDAEDRLSYVSKAIEFLAVLYKEAEERIALRVINFDRDLLFIRNLETDRNVALPLLRAVEQISGLQKVFLQAATSERDPKPFITRTPPVARRDLRGFSFGHTLPGSFIFTVSAPRLPSRTHAQLELKFTDEAEGQNLAQLVAIPFARRISERIARGLLFTKEADEKDYHVLLREYRSGFNANMCRAMVKMAGDGDSRVEFQIAWSPKLPAAKDVADMKAIEVDRDDCSTLVLQLQLYGRVGMLRW